MATEETQRATIGRILVDTIRRAQDDPTHCEGALRKAKEQSLRSRLVFSRAPEDRDGFFWGQQVLEFRWQVGTYRVTSNGLDDIGKFVGIDITLEGTR